MVFLIIVSVNGALQTVFFQRSSFFPIFFNLAWELLFTFQMDRKKTTPCNIPVMSWKCNIRRNDWGVRLCASRAVFCCVHCTTKAVFCCVHCTTMAAVWGTYCWWVLACHEGVGKTRCSSSSLKLTVPVTSLFMLLNSQWLSKTVAVALGSYSAIVQNSQSTREFLLESFI